MYDENGNYDESEMIRARIASPRSPENTLRAGMAIIRTLDAAKEYLEMMIESPPNPIDTKDFIGEYWYDNTQTKVVKVNK